MGDPMRLIQNDCLGIVCGGGTIFANPVSGVWVSCIECGRRDRFTGTDGQIDRLTDAKAIKKFEGLGWTVRPTLCPEHAS